MRTFREAHLLTSAPHLHRRLSHRSNRRSGHSQKNPATKLRRDLIPRSRRHANKAARLRYSLQHRPTDPLNHLAHGASPCPLPTTQPRHTPSAKQTTHRYATTSQIAQRCRMSALRSLNLPLLPRPLVTHLHHIARQRPHSIYELRTPTPMLLPAPRTLRRLHLRLLHHTTPNGTNRTSTSNSKPSAARNRALGAFRPATTADTYCGLKPSRFAHARTDPTRRASASRASTNAPCCFFGSNPTI